MSYAVYHYLDFIDPFFRAAGCGPEVMAEARERFERRSAPASTRSPKPSRSRTGSGSSAAAAPTSSPRCRRRERAWLSGSSGTMVSGGAEPARGRFVALLDVQDLMKAMDAPGEEKLVAYLEHPNVTTMAPIQTRLAAIVCANGDEQAHVAIVSREARFPRAVQVRLDGTEPASSTAAPSSSTPTAP